MSKDNVRSMFGKLEKDHAFQKKFSEFIKSHGDSTENAIAEMLTEFGKTSGFAFSKSDLLAARADLMDKKNANGELGDDELDKVAGGGQHKTEAIVVSVSTLGIGCAVTSVVSDAIAHGTCGTALTASAGCTEF